jgi:LPS export ABC transporter protein LptC
MALLFFVAFVHFVLQGFAPFALAGESGGSYNSFIPPARYLRNRSRFMNSVLKTVLALTLALIVIGSGAVFVGSRLSFLRPESNPPKPKAPLDSMLPPIQVQGMHFKVSEKGKPQWEFALDDTQQMKDGRVALNGLHQGVYYREGKPYLRMKAANATWDRASKALVMGGGVEVTGTDGLRFNAPSLKWSGDKKKIYCPGPIQFRTEDGWVTASQLVADLKKQTFTLQQVSGAFSLDKNLKGAPL